MLDYAQWLQTAIEFVQGLKRLPGTVKVECDMRPPLTKDELAALSERSPQAIPRPLLRFWTTASAHCRLSYSWDVPDPFKPLLQTAFPSRRPDYWLNGGPEFMAAEEIIGWLQEPESYPYEGYPRDTHLWAHSVRFMSVGNGDRVALYLGSSNDPVNLDDPPVVYLCYDGGGSGRYGPSFDEFLRRWARLGYIRFEDLDTFICPQSGNVDPDSYPTRTEALQTLFRGEIRDGPASGKK